MPSITMARNPSDDPLRGAIEPQTPKRSSETRPRLRIGPLELRRLRCVVTFSGRSLHMLVWSTGDVDWVEDWWAKRVDVRS